MKNSQLIFSEVFNIVGYSKYLVDNTLDYATPVKYIIDGYQIAESNGVLYLFQNYNFDINKLLPRDKFHILVSSPRINSILLSIDNGGNWIPLELTSSKTKGTYLHATDMSLRRIVSIEPLSENKDYLKIGFVRALLTGDQPEYFNFKRVNARYEIE